MRWMILFIFSNLFSPALKSQSGDGFINDIKANHQSYKELKEIFDLYWRRDSLAIVNLTEDYPYFVTREMTFEIDYRKNYSFPSNLSLFYKKDKIVYLKIFTPRGIGEEDIFFQYIDSNFSEDVLRKHNAKYGTDFLLGNMYARKRTTPMFDTHWSTEIFPFRDTVSTEMKRLFECVLNRDSMTIIRYAANFSPEMTGYGATGLYIWERENNHLDKKTKALLRSLQRSNCPIVFTRGGCLVWTEKLSSVTSDNSLQGLYEEYLLFKKERIKDVPCQAPAGSTFL
ncbi:MAG: hypothetical protein E6H09_06580 [Bacteroidetes bacterium]|nr:MAG: hypothetical protein E6H09_06580 [Bacteroidota bacterium]